MEPSGSEASEARSKDKGNAPVIDLDSENVNQHVDEHIDERVTDDVDEQKKKRRLKSFSAFSTGGSVIDEYRSSLTPKTAEALICAQDWLRSTPADLQDMPINGLPVEEMVENLKKLELGNRANRVKLC
ncbi:zinc finger BED domain-containing protein RICESLEEPER 2-like protein [Tanacetum coccineum]|uniref:Zinc finger BED domain-containing protein RICESLEEPER 2-like protein n=1 Tax=Tanacetum coccineum TaxID=301880 RepID=A0ABQ5C331_9ASTR